MSKLYRAFLPFIFCIATLLSAYPAAAGDAFDEMADRAEKCGVAADSVSLIRDADSSFSTALLEPLLKACVEQLPQQPLQDKLAEGMAKHVPPALIVRALEKRLASYASAREILLTTVGSLDQETLAVVGEGVDKGVPVQDFESFAGQYGSLPPDVFRTAAAMVSLQGQAGFNFALTGRIIEEGAREGDLSPDWRYFVRTILVARGHGVSDEAIADGAVVVLQRGGSAAEVMAELGFTDRNLEGRADK